LAAGGDLPGAVLFACSHNAVRSPMAEAILKHLAGSRVFVDSAGVRAGEPDPFAALVMDEIGIDLSRHRPKSLDEVNDGSFDLIVSLSPEAHHKALSLAEGYAVEVEYWPMPNPSVAEGSREQMLEAYRALRDTLFGKIKQRFGIVSPGGV
jgi:protein-tyrosine-phosphatase